MNAIKTIIKWITLILVVIIILQVCRQFFLEEELAFRNDLYCMVKQSFPDANQKVQTLYGLHPYVRETKPADKTDADVAKRPGAGSIPRPAVVLIHGLDEPGRVWWNLSPVLDRKGYPVLLMSYPNDQQITDSARFMLEALAAYDFGAHPSGSAAGIVLIGHSMGGLVAREMLTRPELDYGGKVSAGSVPKVSALIMVGTPNHGAQLARFRIVMEVKEQILNLLDEDAHWLMGVLDGTGAAGLNLLPGSQFLTGLNSRPHAPGTDYHVISGMISPWPFRDEFKKTPGKHLSDNGTVGAGIAGNLLHNVSEILGDGLVTAGSTRLDHVPYTLVRGNHLTMIRNFSRKSTRTPPAIPVILDLLDRHVSQGTMGGS